jgi:hypothetical protein
MLLEVPPVAAVEYLPASQAEQEAAAAGEYDPAGQLAHAVLDPTSAENVPGSQLAQEEAAPVDDSLPAGQLVQTLASACE